MTHQQTKINKLKLLRFVIILLIAVYIVTALSFINALAANKTTNAVASPEEPVAAASLQTLNQTLTGSDGLATYPHLAPFFVDVSTLKIDELNNNDLDISFHVSDEDVKALAKMLYGETRSVQGFTSSSGRYVSNTEQIAACVWTVLNRVDAGYSNSIIDIITAKNQYTGYKSTNPVSPELAALAKDCIIRWQLEKALEQQGVITNTGRVLPEPDTTNKWCWFNSAGNGHNAFRGSYSSSEVYDWSLDTPYTEDIIINLN